MDIESELQRSIFSNTRDKSFIDKLIARSEVDAIRDIVKNRHLTREQILEMFYLMLGIEAKLVNYSANDRYVILKFFVWIREFVKVAELLYDYEDDLELKDRTCVSCAKEVGKGCVCVVPKRSIALSDRTKKNLLNAERYIEHGAKFLVDLYLNIARTSLSLGATGFLEILKNKYEITYPNLPKVSDGGDEKNFMGVKR